MEGSVVQDFSNLPFAEGIKSVLPPGHEFIGFVDQDGKFFSEEDIKAIEWREKNKMERESSYEIPETLKSLLSDPYPKIGDRFVRTVKRCFHFENSFIAIANDDTVWHLKAGQWKKLEDAATPPLPQERV